MAVAQTDRDAQVAPAPQRSSSIDRSPWPRRIAWALGIFVVLAVGTRLTAGFPEGLVIGVEDWFSDVDAWVIENQRTFWLFTSVLNPLQDAITSVVEGLNAVFERMTWLGLLVGAGMLAGVAAGWKMGLLASAGVATFGLLGVWERSLQTLSLMTISVLVALAIGIPLGILAGRRPGVDRVLRPILDGMQTIPAYSYLLPFVLFLGTGYPPALAATVVFAVPPAVRLTSLGIRSVPTTTMEVAESFGTTSRQTLRKVQIPIARPSMMLGVNQTIMMVLSVVIIGGMIGAGGLGFEALVALSKTLVGRGVVVGLSILLLAVMLDRLTQALGSAPRSMRGPVGLGGFVRWPRLRAIGVRTTEEPDPEQGQGEGEA